MRIERDWRKTRWGRLLIALLAAAFILSLNVRCSPEGLYFSEMFEALCPNNKGFCIITKFDVCYFVNYMEDTREIGVLASGSVKRLARGDVVLEYSHCGHDYDMRMETFWWGVKIYSDHGEIWLGWRRFGI